MINILDVIDHLGPNQYLAILANSDSPPVISVTEHANYCVDCSRFLTYHRMSRTADGTLFYAYRIKPKYPACTEGRNLLLKYFTKEYTVSHTWNRKSRHGSRARNVS